MIRKLVGTVAMALVLVAGAQAQRAGRWEYLGEAHVDGAVDHDRIAVTAARGEYRAIQLRVQNGPIEFGRVVVHFGNGSAQEIAVRQHIRAGGQTRVIDLPGDRRVIQSVELWYARANWRENRPLVRLWGRH